MTTCAHEWNAKLSEALYGVTQGLEVALRNSAHQVLSAAFRREDWYEIAPLLPEQANQVRQAKQRIQSDGRDLTAGRVVAGLMFGFWTSLVGTGYAQTLWDKHLNQAFPMARLSRKTVAKRLHKVRLLRNRVAHHESVIGMPGRERNLQRDVAEILELLGWVCETTAQWVSHTSSFDDYYAAKPAEQKGG